MPYEFDRVIDRRAIGNLNKWRVYGEDVLPLWVADMDFRAPDPVLDELRGALDHGILGYELGSPAQPTLRLCGPRGNPSESHLDLRLRL